MNESAVRLAVEKICTELGWETSIQPLSEYTLILSPLPADPHFAGVLFVISSATSRFMMYVSYRVKASAKRWHAMAEACTRINSGLLGGCLELDTEKGEIRYRDGLILLTSKVDAKLLQALVATTLRDALVYYPAIEAVAGGQLPDKALASLEKDKATAKAALLKKLPEPEKT